MYNLLIVDDEIYVRDKIKDFINETGKFNVFLAEDGVEAIEIVKRKNIKAIILDINMPRMDGIEVLRILKESNRDILSIVVSGYDEFEYAQKAVKYGAIDYLLKPLMPEQMEKVLDNTYKLILKKEAEQKKYQKLKKQVMNSKAVLKERFFNNLIFSNISLETAIEQAGFLSINLNYSNFRLSLIEIDKSGGKKTEENYQVLLKQVEIFIENQLKSKPGHYLFQINSGRFIILNGYNDSLLERDYREFLELLKTIIESKLNIKITIGISDEFNSLDKTKSAYSQAKISLSYRLLLGHQHVLSIKDMYEKEFLVVDEPDLNRFSILVRTLQIVEIKKDIKEVFNVIKRSKKDINILNVRLIIAKYIFSLISILQEYGLAEDYMYDIFIEIKQKKTIEELEEWIIIIIENHLKKIEEYQNKRSSFIVEKIKKYIFNNYKEEITLISLSDLFGYSPNYLGHYFKIHTRQSVSEFINKNRISKAKELLKNTNMKIYNIAFEVGYSDQNYFCTVFKKHEGLTPKEFRKIV